MSASRKKKERNMQKAATQQKTSGLSKSTRDTIIVMCVFVVVIAAIVVGMLIHNHHEEQKLLEPDYDVNVAAATIGSDNISVPVLNYFYMDQINSFYSSYGSYISMFFNPDLPLDQQEYSGASLFGNTEDAEEYDTWDAYFLGSAEQAAREIYNLKQAAEAEGASLSDDAKSYIDSTIENVKTTAENNGYNNADLYLASIYGSGCNLDNYREYLEAQRIATEFYQEHNSDDSFEFTDEEIQAAYDEDPSAFDGVSYHMFSSHATGTTDEDGNHVDATEEELQKALEDAQSMKAAFDEGKATEFTDRNMTSATESTDEQTAKWLFDSARKEGDVEMFSSEDGDIHYVVKFISRDDHNYDMANLKVIYIKKDTEDAEDDTADNAEDETTDTVPAEEKYQAVIDSLTGNATEDNFDALIKEYSEDSGVSSDNGVKDHVNKSNGTTFGDEANAWIFSNPGVGTWKQFETDNGYYVIWHNGYGENYQKHLVTDSLVDAAREEWYEANAHSNEIVVNDDMRQYRKHAITTADYFAAANNNTNS